MAFSTNEELLNAVRDLISVLKIRGAEASAKTLQDGLQCITGLTDGWAFFLGAIIQVEKNFSDQLLDNEKLLIGELHDAIYLRVYGRKRHWWKFWSRFKVFKSRAAPSRLLKL